VKLKNKKYIREFIFPALSLIFIVGITVFIINRYFPRIGHDYRYHIPRMLDTYLYSQANGLSIQWYTPSFGGGLPAHPNPLNIQYSLPQLLMSVLNPWWALMFSLMVYSSIGFITFYFFLKDELKLSNYASSLGATFILANGFYVEHAIVGHIGYQQFPLLGLILYLAFTKKLDWLATSVLLGIIGALIINQAGFYLIVIFILSLAITIPLIYLLTPQIFDWRRMIFSFSIGVFFAILLSASKLSAIYSFMRFFPRSIFDDYGKTYIQGLFGMAIQLLGCFMVIPYYLLTGKDLKGLPQFFQGITGASYYGIWETDISISPSLVLLLAAGVINLAFFARNKYFRFSKENLIAVLFLFFGIWLASDFTLAQGWLYQAIKPLPVITSLHVNVRFASVFILPVAFLGAYIFNTLYKGKESASLAPFLFLNILAILSLFVYLPLGRYFHRRNFNIAPSLSTYSQISSGHDFSVSNISDVSDDKVFPSKSSNLYKMDEAIFGYWLEYFKPDLHPGDIFEISGGYYNMTNPASYVFPAENNLQPFERFRVDQLTELEHFVSRKQFNLKISVLQQASNYLSLAAITGLLLYIIIQVRLFLLRVFKKNIPPD
jgi:hypothetical protein